MGSINPVFALPELLESKAEEFAKQYVASLTLGTGQFCTNPGILVAQTGSAFERLKAALSEAIQEAKPTAMLHPGIAKNYLDKKQPFHSQEQVTIVGQNQPLKQSKHKGNPLLP